MAFILATTLRAAGGPGWRATAGVESGYLVHVRGRRGRACPRSSRRAPRLFTAVKVLGAAWLLWMAWRTVRRARSEGHAWPTCARPARRAPSGRSRAFSRGLLVGALNPKTAMFYLAFLPQFVSPDGGPAWAQLLVFGLLFIVLAAALDSCWALAGGSCGAAARPYG